MVLSHANGLEDKARSVLVLKYTFLTAIYRIYGKPVFTGQKVRNMSKPTELNCKYVYPGVLLTGWPCLNEYKVEMYILHKLGHI